MPSLTAPMIAGVLALAALASQTPPDDRTESTRLTLEAQRRELRATLQDRNWMQDQSRATLARLQIARNWQACAENEALALAKGSEKAARLLAESALAACRPWQEALELALENGAYPYVEGPDASGRPSREDMVTAAQLASRDAALDRILQWRGVARTVRAAPQAPPRLDPAAGIIAKPAPIQAKPAPAQSSPSAEADEAIVITARLSRACRVRLADRTLTERELGAKAREWAAAGIALKVIRPGGADYRCMARIAWQLGRHGLRLFEFVEAPN